MMGMYKAGEFPAIVGRRKEPKATVIKREGDCPSIEVWHNRPQGLKEGAGERGDVNPPKPPIDGRKPRPAKDFRKVDDFGVPFQEYKTLGNYTVDKEEAKDFHKVDDLDGLLQNMKTIGSGKPDENDAEQKSMIGKIPRRPVKTMTVGEGGIVQIKDESL